MPRIILFLALAVMALAACSSGDPPDPRGPATDSATILPGSPAASSDSPNASPQSGPDITASTDDHGYGQGTVFQIEYLGAVAEYTNNELVDLIVLEHYIGRPDR